MVDPHQTHRGLAVPLTEGDRDIPPGGSREVRFDVYAIETAPWLTDARLATPGQYQLRVVLANEIAPNGDATVNRDGEFDRSAAFVSNDATLRVLAQSDDDRSVWEWMQKVSGGAWGASDWGKQDFPKFVMDQHPRSGYALYAVVGYPMHDGKDKYALLEDVIRRFPDASFTDQLRLNLMQDHRNDGAWVIARQGDINAAAEEYDTVRRIGTELDRKRRSSWFRDRGKELVDSTPTREQLLHPHPAAQEED